jgi:hypothetical protein
MGDSGYEDNQYVPFGMCPDYSENNSLKPTPSDTSNLDFNILSLDDVEEELDLFLRNEY